MLTNLNILRTSEYWGLDFRYMLLKIQENVKLLKDYSRLLQDLHKLLQDTQKLGFCQTIQGFCMSKLSFCKIISGIFKTVQCVQGFCKIIQGVCNCKEIRVGHRVLFRSVRSVLFHSLKGTFRSFFEFLATYETQKNVPFFSSLF